MVSQLRKLRFPLMIRTTYGKRDKGGGTAYQVSGRRIGHVVLLFGCFFGSKYVAAMGVNCTGVRWNFPGRLGENITSTETVVNTKWLKVETDVGDRGVLRLYCRQQQVGIHWGVSE